MSSRLQESVTIPSGGVRLEGDLVIPADARGVVVFAHGSGSSRLSPRNRFVAEALREENLGTLLMDLLTLEEEALDAQTRHLRFDITLLARRLVDAAHWLQTEVSSQGQALGYFGASTGAGAALVAAAEQPDLIQAVVSRGGRPDLAGGALDRVRAPTLLIVGGLDEPVIEMNREALSRLRSVKRLVIVPGASHLFEEPGALEQVARLARGWFASYLQVQHEKGESLWLK